VIEDPANDNNTDEDEDGVEPHFEGATFHFTSGNEPDEQTGVYGSAQNFIQAMLDKTMPTLLVKGSNYSNLQELLLENVCPVQFPFGLHLSEQCIGRHLLVLNVASLQKEIHDLQRNGCHRRLQRLR
jgi:hypothetical protein